jgi:hypothetical protein
MGVSLKLILGAECVHRVIRLAEHLAVGHDNLFHGDRYKWSLQLTAINITNETALYNFSQRSVEPTLRRRDPIRRR